MAKKYRVTLTDEERETLQALIKKRNPTAIQVKRAYVLLATDDLREKRWGEERCWSKISIPA